LALAFVKSYETVSRELQLFSLALAISWRGKHLTTILKTTMKSPSHIKRGQAEAKKEEGREIAQVANESSKDQTQK